MKKLWVFFWWWLLYRANTNPIKLWREDKAIQKQLREYESKGLK